MDCAKPFSLLTACKIEKRNRVCGSRAPECEVRGLLMEFSFGAESEGGLLWNCDMRNSMMSGCRYCFFIMKNFVW